ncbi:hypothetical protein OPT61_g6291 [Boeremia exigua]|uniref:Uncharacterized protein n=1 Tax=Boeremia exigua TaxID=749465 RepID=A0ACC2I7B1_9PLEO|nr:hypothetical protein OPT61_g6291 [Boeremia exigua]
MPSRKRARLSECEQPSKKLRTDALMVASYVGDISSPFFRLSAELRNQVYDALWHLTPPVSAYQSQSKTEIRAFHSSAVVGPRQKDFGRYRSYNSTDTPARKLPQWLLTSKAFLREAVAQFNRKSHWLLRPVMRAGDFTPLHPSTIMVPGLASALSLGMLTIETLLGMSTIEQSPLTGAIVRVAHAEALWLVNLADYLEAQNVVRWIGFTLKGPGVAPKGTVLDISPLVHLLERLPALETVEIVLRLVSSPGMELPREPNMVEQMIVQAIGRVMEQCLGKFAVEEGLLPGHILRKNCVIVWSRGILTFDHGNARVFTFRRVE